MKKGYNIVKRIYLFKEPYEWLKQPTTETVEGGIPLR